MEVLAEEKIGPYLVRVEQWRGDGAVEVGLSITHDYFDHRTYLTAEQARGLFDFLLLHIRQLEAGQGENGPG